MLRVDHARWGQTAEDLRRLATSAPHLRTRERFLALYEVTQESCATRVAARTRRHPQTVMEWLHLYSTGGPLSSRSGVCWRAPSTSGIYWSISTRRTSIKMPGQDAGLGHGWSERGRRFWVASGSPRLADKLSFYGLYLYNEGEVRLWPYARANGEHTTDVLRRLRAEWPDRKLMAVWDGAPYHRARMVREAAAALRIELVPLPGYSPDFMPVEALWRWLREDVTYHHCHPTADDLSRRIAAFEARLNQDRCAVADRLWVKDQLDPEEEKLRFPN